MAAVCVHDECGASARRVRARTPVVGEPAPAGVGAAGAEAGAGVVPAAAAEAVVVVTVAAAGPDAAPGMRRGVGDSRDRGE